MTRQALEVFRDILPDAAMLILALAGVSYLMPGAIKKLENSKFLRLAAGLMLIALGLSVIVLNYRARSTQETERQRNQTELRKAQDGLKEEQTRNTGMLTALITRVDKIIEHPASPEQKKAAQQIKGEILGNLTHKRFETNSLLGAKGQPPTIGLDAAKGKALDLVEEIDGYIKQRGDARRMLMASLNQQAVLTNSNDELEKRRNTFDETTVQFFLHKFAARTEESISELKARGAYVKNVEEYCRMPMPMTILDCSSAIRKAANELQPGVIPPTIPANIQITQNVQTRSPDPKFPFASVLIMRTDRTILHVAFIVTYDHVPDKVEPQNYGPGEKQLGFRHMFTLTTK